MKVVIIGSGISGLTTAAYLARAGHEVTIFEQHSLPGGVTSTLRQGGFCWDLGPLLLEGFSPGERARQVLDELQAAPLVHTRPGERAYHFPDFELWPPEPYPGPYWRRARLEQMFPRERSGLARYYRYYDQVMDLLALSNRLAYSNGSNSLANRLAWLFARLRLRSRQAWSASQLMDECFDDPRLKAVFTGVLADFRVPPSRFPAMAVPPLNSEHAFDSRIPRRLSAAGLRPSHVFIHGGVGSLAQALAAVYEKAGGRLFTSSLVAQIVLEDYALTGVRLADGHFEPAQVLVATGGARETFIDLLGGVRLPGGFSRQVHGLPLTHSALQVHLGLDFDPQPYQRGPLCFYFQHYDIQGAIEDSLSDYKPGEDGFRIYIPSMHSPQFAPEGGHAVTVMCIAPNELAEGDWDSRREEMVDQLLIRAERIIPGLRERALVRLVVTPADYRRRLHLRHHAYGGVAPRMGVAGLPHRSPIQNLWFAGDQSESGGGVPAVMSGARRVALQILERA